MCSSPARWYRTGDLGVLDSDGYLRITGRIKELINRGGEKISPTEIDAVLLGDPAVAEAASFAVPDPIYGQEIQAAVVPQADVTAAELQAYCRSRLADFKVPKVIHFVKELPKDSTGKVERRHLTELFSKKTREVLHGSTQIASTSSPLMDRSRLHSD